MMPDPYLHLAPYYDQLGMSDFAYAVAPQIVHFAHGHDWVGRRMVDLGCGTGGGVRWFTGQGYNVTAVDPSEAMLNVARANVDSSGVALQWVRGDASAVEALHDIDLITALDVVNELNSLRELEAMFNSVARGLPPGKLFVFDLHTLEGLAEDHGVTHVLRSDDALTAITSADFDYERQVRTDHYLIFARSGQTWQRQEISHSRRGFAVQVVATLLGRTGFQVIGIVSAAFQPIQPANPDTTRALFFARRGGA